MYRPREQESAKPGMTIEEIKQLTALRIANNLGLLKAENNVPVNNAKPMVSHNSGYGVQHNSHLTQFSSAAASSYAPMPRTIKEPSVNVPSHSLSVQELKQLTKMRLANEVEQGMDDVIVKERTYNQEYRTQPTSTYNPTIRTVPSIAANYAAANPSIISSSGNAIITDNVYGGKPMVLSRRNTAKELYQSDPYAQEEVSDSSPMKYINYKNQLLAQQSSSLMNVMPGAQGGEDKYKTLYRNHAVSRKPDPMEYLDRSTLANSNSGYLTNTIARSSGNIINPNASYSDLYSHNKSYASPTAAPTGTHYDMQTSFSNLVSKSYPTPRASSPLLVLESISNSPVQSRFGTASAATAGNRLLGAVTTNPAAAVGSHRLTSVDEDPHTSTENSLDPKYIYPGMYLTASQSLQPAAAAAAPKPRHDSFDELLYETAHVNFNDELLQDGLSMHKWSNVSAMAPGNPVQHQYPAFPLDYPTQKHPGHPGQSHVKYQEDDAIRSSMYANSLLHRYK